jgi:AcrR family transcriptional regulator
VEVDVDRSTMSDVLDDASGGGDGRTARRDRNRVAVLDAVLTLFSEDNPNPSPEQVAQRSGVSLRSVYRYVADADDLIRSAIERHVEIVQPLFVIDDLGRGSLPHRLETFIDARLRLYEAIAPTARAARLRAPTNDAIRRQLELRRRFLREQTERQFAPELDRLGAPVRAAVLGAVDALTQIETIDLYRHLRRCSPNDTRQMLDIALRALLAGKY